MTNDDQNGGLSDDELGTQLSHMGSCSTPPVDPRFADALESRLRQHHGEQRHARQRRGFAGLSMRGAVVGIAASVLAIAAVLGLTQLRSGDSSIPLEIADAAATEAANASDSPAVGPTSDAAAPTVSPAPTAASTQTPAPPPPTLTTESNTGAVVATDPTATPASTPSPLPPADPTATATPPTPAATPAAVPIPTATATPEPPPAATPEPTSTPTATATPQPATPTPTPTPTPAPIEVTLECAQRVASNGVGVRCSWAADGQPPIDRWVLVRIRNGAAREQVASVRVQVAEADDLGVQSGDEIIYAVQGQLGDDVIVISSTVSITIR